MPPQGNQAGGITKRCRCLWSGGFQHHGGTPSHHQLLDGIFTNKNHTANWGYPHDYGNPHSRFFSISHILVRCFSWPQAGNTHEFAKAPRRPVLGPNCWGLPRSIQPSDCRPSGWALRPWLRGDGPVDAWPLGGAQWGLCEMSRCVRDCKYWEYVKVYTYTVYMHNIYILSSSKWPFQPSIQGHLSPKKVT